MATKVTRRVRGGPVGWNLAKAQMAASIKELEKTLEHNGEIPRKRRIELRKTLRVMRGIAKVANQIPCAGPFMSFGFKYVAAESVTAPTARRRKA